MPSVCCEDLAIEGSGPRRSPSIGRPQSLRGAKVAKREIAERIDGELTVEASPPCPKAADVRRDVDAAYDRCAVRSLVLSISDLPARNAPPARAPAAVPLADERRPVERDLHEGVQNELVALVVKLALAREDAGIPPPVAKTLAGSKVRARAALDMVREIVRGTYPPQLADFDLARALRARRRAARSTRASKGRASAQSRPSRCPGPPGRKHTNDDDTPDVLREMCGRSCVDYAIARSRDG